MMLIVSYFPGARAIHYWQWFAAQLWRHQRCHRAEWLTKKVVSGIVKQRPKQRRDATWASFARRPACPSRCTWESAGSGRKLRRRGWRAWSLLPRHDWRLAIKSSHRVSMRKQRAM